MVNKFNIYLHNNLHTVAHCISIKQGFLNHLIPLTKNEGFNFILSL